MKTFLFFCVLLFIVIILSFTFFESLSFRFSNPFSKSSPQTSQYNTLFLGANFFTDQDDEKIKKFPKESLAEDLKDISLFMNIQVIPPSSSCL